MPTVKNDQLRVRVSKQNKEIIRYAADCMGQDLTSYILGVALKKAKIDIKEHQEIQKLVLSRADFSKVEKELMNPSEANDALKSVFSDSPDVEDVVD